MRDSDFPDWWSRAPLAQLTVKLVDGSHNPPKKQTTGQPMLSAVNIVGNKILYSSYRLICPDAFEIENQRTRIEPGDILLTIVGAIGRAAVVPTDYEPFTLQRSVAVITPAIMDSEFLMYQFESPRIANFFKKNARGTAQKGVYLRTLGTTDIWFPSVSEQQRIVAKIEELFSELDNGIESLNSVREQLKVYRQAILDHAASGQLLVSHGVIPETFGEHSLTSLEDIVLELGQGWSPRCLNHPTPDESSWGVIKTTAIQHGVFNASEHKQLPDHLDPRPHLSIVPDDILVTRAGPRKRVGVACLVKKCRQRLMLCDKAYRLRADEHKVVPAYLEMLLNSPRVLQDIEELKTGINDSGVNLTQDRFLALKVLVPSLEIQCRTLEELESVMSQIDHLTDQIESSLAQADSLRQSILEKAFAGRLVAQDPSDEPASELLERLKAEKGTNNKKTRKKEAA